VGCWIKTLAMGSNLQLHCCYGTLFIWSLSSLISSVKSKARGVGLTSHSNQYRNCNNPVVVLLRGHPLVLGNDSLKREVVFRQGGPRPYPSSSYVTFMTPRCGSLLGTGPTGIGIALPLSLAETTDLSWLRHRIALLSWNNLH